MEPHIPRPAPAPDRSQHGAGAFRKRLLRAQRSKRALSKGVNSHPQTSAPERAGQHPQFLVQAGFANRLGPGQPKHNSAGDRNRTGVHDSLRGQGVRERAAPRGSGQAHLQGRDGILIAAANYSTAYTILFYVP